jgi:hypothetical protein
VKIDEFCELLKRYSIKFEHHHVCILKEDLNDEKVFLEWLHMYDKYLLEHSVGEKDE